MLEIEAVSSRGANYRIKDLSMPTVTFITHDGNQNEFSISSGGSLMQAAIDNGVDGIIAECGGACSCATCHCFVDDAWMSRLPEASDIERDMLECVLDPQHNSRLSCQIEVTDEVDGLVVRVPENQY